MQTLIPSSSITQPVASEETQSSSLSSRADRLKAIYRQIFKENRDLDFFHNSALDSAYVNGELTTQQFITKLLCSEMYRDYILAVNSNYHFVALCFERVLGRPATDEETRVWSSLLATDGLQQFAKSLTQSNEYVAAFGTDGVPTRRSLQLSSSKQGLPALPESSSRQRYDGPGRINQLYPGRVQIYYNPSQCLWEWNGALPPESLRKVGAVITVAGVIEVTRIVVTLAWAAVTSGSL